jgi:hypothetical protein
VIGDDCEWTTAQQAGCDGAAPTRARCFRSTGLDTDETDTM